MQIPQELLPTDGRFGSGPARIHPDALAKLGTRNDIMGTSHRAKPVRDLVANVQRMFAQLFNAPDGYEVVLGNGGATTFWDVAVFSLIIERSAHGVFGEFGAKFAKESADAPFLEEPSVNEAENGDLALPKREECDVVAWAQNETSTGVAAPVRRLGGFGDALFLTDATSAAGGMPVDVSETDVYYFSPQKNLGGDGGLWFAICSPAAIERARKLQDKREWIPASLDLVKAIDNSAKHQTLNTPSIANLLLIESQLEWLLENGGLDFAVARTERSSQLLYSWAEKHELTTPFVKDPLIRSQVTVTIDLDERIPADDLLAVLRENGIVDINSYRSLGRNQIRVGTFAAVDPADVEALINCLDWTLERM